MANLTINDLPDELMAKIKQLANQNNCSLNQQVIVILKELLQDEKPKLLTSQNTDTTQQKRRKSVPQLIARIENIHKELPTDIEWLDSTKLIREDRDNR
ncbi:MAG: hypothetical protein AAGJ08_11205 [Cyanobacteria bacterium P01_H01_bin.35]